MIPYIIILAIGVILFFVIYFLGVLLGLVFLGTAPKQLVIAYNLSYLIPISAVIYGVYGIIKYLFF